MNSYSSVVVSLFRLTLVNDLFLEGERERIGRVDDVILEHISISICVGSIIVF